MDEQEYEPTRMEKLIPSGRLPEINPVNTYITAGMELIANSIANRLKQQKPKSETISAAHIIQKISGIGIVRVGIRIKDKEYWPVQSKDYFDQFIIREAGVVIRSIGYHRYIKNSFYETIKEFDRPESYISQRERIKRFLFGEHYGKTGELGLIVADHYGHEHTFLHIHV